MTLREANAEAVRLFGKGAYCESARGRRTVSFLRRRGLRHTFNFPPKTDWKESLAYLATLAPEKTE